MRYFIGVESLSKAMATVHAHTRRGKTKVAQVKQHVRRVEGAAFKRETVPYNRMVNEYIGGGRLAALWGEKMDRNPYKKEALAYGVGGTASWAAEAKGYWDSGFETVPEELRGSVKPGQTPPYLLGQRWKDWVEEHRKPGAKKRATGGGGPDFEGKYGTGVREEPAKSERPGRRQSPWFDEKINFGGEIVTRAHAIIEMQREGVDQKRIEAYMMGAREWKEPAGEAEKPETSTEKTERIGKEIAEAMKPAEKRFADASPAQRGLHPAAADYMTEEEHEEVKKLQSQLPGTGRLRLEAKARLKAKYGIGKPKEETRPKEPEEGTPEENVKAKDYKGYQITATPEMRQVGYKGPTKKGSRHVGGYLVKEPDGYERHFNKLSEAKAWIDGQSVESEKAETEDEPPEKKKEPEKKPSEEPAKDKAPWELTREDFTAQWGDSEQLHEQAKKYHFSHVEYALKDKKPVPADVLADYPGLKESIESGRRKVAAIEPGLFKAFPRLRYVVKAIASVRAHPARGKTGIYQVKQHLRHYVPVARGAKPLSPQIENVLGRLEASAREAYHMADKGVEYPDFDNYAHAEALQGMVEATRGGATPSEAAAVAKDRVMHVIANNFTRHGPEGLNWQRAVEAHTGDTILTVSRWLWSAAKGAPGPYRIADAAKVAEGRAMYGGEKAPWQKTRREYEAQGTIDIPKSHPLVIEMDLADKEYRQAVGALVPTKVRHVSGMDVATKRSTIGAAMEYQPYTVETALKSTAVSRAAKDAYRSSKTRRDAASEALDLAVDHRTLVEAAVRRGDPVPPEVLKEYDDILAAALNPTLFKSSRPIRYIVKAMATVRAHASRGKTGVHQVRQHIRNVAGGAPAVKGQGKPEKQTWQMGLEEFTREALAGKVPELLSAVNGMHGAKELGMQTEGSLDTYQRGLEEAIKAEHQAQVATAVAWGKDVPAGVIAEHPSIASWAKEIGPGAKALAGKSAPIAKAMAHVRAHQVRTDTGVYQRQSYMRRYKPGVSEVREERAPAPAETEGAGLEAEPEKKPEPEAKPAPAHKPAHEMNADEIIEHVQKLPPGVRANPWEFRREAVLEAERKANPEGDIEKKKDIIDWAVMQAILSKKPIPPEVLADYPDLVEWIKKRDYYRDKRSEHREKADESKDGNVRDAHRRAADSHERAWRGRKISGRYSELPDAGASARAEKASAAAEAEEELVISTIGDPLGAAAFRGAKSGFKPVASAKRMVSTSQSLMKGEKAATDGRWILKTEALPKNLRAALDGTPERGLYSERKQEERDSVMAHLMDRAETAKIAKRTEFLGYGEYEDGGTALFEVEYRDGDHRAASLDADIYGYLAKNGLDLQAADDKTGFLVVFKDGKVVGLVGGTETKVTEGQTPASRLHQIQTGIALARGEEPPPPPPEPEKSEKSEKAPAAEGEVKKDRKRGERLSARKTHVGKTFTRTYQGKKIEATVEPEGVKYRVEGGEWKSSKSLSRVALEVTGKTWNGNLFFGVKREE